MICKKCKTDNDNNAAFCRVCGQKLKRSKLSPWYILVSGIGIIVCLYGIFALIFCQGDYYPSRNGGWELAYYYDPLRIIRSVYRNGYQDVCFALIAIGLIIWGVAALIHKKLKSRGNK